MTRAATRNVLSVPAIGKKEVAAIQAVYNGTASEYQQKFAIDIIMKQLCRINEEPFYPTERDTSFALGMAHVARQIITLVETPLGKMK